jgi:anti-sigma factor RsiW
MMRLPFRRGHRAWEERLHDYADGRQSAPDAARFEAHMGGCKACTSMLASVQTMKAAFVTLPEREAPRSFRLTADMVAAPAREAAPLVRPKPAWALRTAQAAAGFAAIGLFTIIAVDLSGGANTSGDDDDGGSAAMAEQAEALAAQEAAADSAAGAGTAEGTAQATSNEPVLEADPSDVEDAAGEDSAAEEPPTDELEERARDESAEVMPDTEAFSLEAPATSSEDGDDTALRVLQAAFGAALIAALAAFVYLRRA